MTRATAILNFVATGSALPDLRVTNADIAPLIGLDAAYIERLFDVRARHWSRHLDSTEPALGQRASDLAVTAARRALGRSGLDTDAVDTLLCVTSTPEMISPPTDYIVATKLGIRPAFAMTIHAACTGLFRALAVADALAASGKLGIALITLSEVISPYFRLEPDLARCHRLSSALYADGAAAIVVGVGVGGIARCVWHDHRTRLRGDPPGIVFPGPLAAMGGGASPDVRNAVLGYHDFRAVLDGGSELTAIAAQSALRACTWATDDVRYFVTHQATGRIKRIAEALGFPADRVPTNIERVGNTISASVPILLDELVPSFVRGDRIVLCTAESATWSYGSLALEAL